MRFQLITWEVCEQQDKSQLKQNTINV
uniref:Uncharacterized protein n=1 Tax=Arundo donax TaxID=35708 RepID=A0A0A9BI65_ARUDO